MNLLAPLPAEVQYAIYDLPPIGATAFVALVAALLGIAAIRPATRRRVLTGLTCGLAAFVALAILSDPFLVVVSPIGGRGFTWSDRVGVPALIAVLVTGTALWLMHRRGPATLGRASHRLWFVVLALLALAYVVTCLGQLAMQFELI